MHCYCNPASSTDSIPGVRFHAVRPLVSSRRRIGYAVECASFAAAATRAVRATKHTFDIVDVCRARRMAARRRDRARSRPRASTPLARRRWTGSLARRSPGTGGAGDHAGLRGRTERRAAPVSSGPLLARHRRDRTRRRRRHARTRRAGRAHRRHPAADRRRTLRQSERLECSKRTRPRSGRPPTALCRPQFREEGPRRCTDLTRRPGRDGAPRRRRRLRSDPPPAAGRTARCRAPRALRGRNGPPRAILPRRRPPRPSHQERSVGERAPRGHGSRAADRHERRRRRRRSREEPRRRRRDRRPVTDRPTNRASGAARRSRTDDASRRGRTKRSPSTTASRDTRRRRWRRTSVSYGRSVAFDRCRDALRPARGRSASQHCRHSEG